MSKKFFLLLLMLCFVVFSFSQTNTYNDISIASPTAGSLGKFVDQPVNLHTGLPTIGFPIYSVKEGPLNLDISLSYHASGLKVLEPASWVGAGWTLNAGGVITRSVVGAPDERGTSNVSGHSHGYYSDNGFSRHIMVPHLGEQMEDWEDIARGYKDGEPDIFFFNFGNYSGKFIFRDDRLPLIFPQQDLKISAEYSGIGSISSFTVTTPDGVIYSFGKTASTTDIDPIEITKASTASNGITSANVTSSWFLNKITSPDQLFSITLNYVQENYSYFTLSTFPLDGNATGFDYELIKNMVLGVRLSEIVFSNGKVVFDAGELRTDLSGSSTPSLIDDANSQARPLSSISVLFNGACKDKYIFNTDYFIDNTTPLAGYFSSYGITSDKKRLKLNSFQKVSCDGTQSINPTAFTYHTELVPRRLSFGQDFWGYINGVTTNTKLVPTYTLEGTTTVSGANRNPAWPAMRGGLLNKITYPTGGSTDFEFEANRVWIAKTTNSFVQKGSISIGYSSPMYGSRETTVALNAGMHKLVLGSNGGTQTAFLYLMTLGGTSLQILQAAPNSSQTLDFNLPTSGTYKLVVTKDCPSTGIGATGTISAAQLVDASENMVVGGARIKTITKKASPGTSNIIQSFDYNFNSQSTGVLYGKPTCVQVIRNDMQRDIGYWTPNNGYTIPCSINGCIECDQGPGFRSYYKSGANLRPMDQTQGSHIGYNEVKVYQANNGYEVNRFYGSQPWQINGNSIAITNVDRTYCSNDIPNFPEAPKTYDFLRGQLRQRQVFNQAGDLLEEQFNYPEYSNFNDPGYLGLIVQTISVPGNTRYLGTRYEQNTKYLSKIVTHTRSFESGLMMENYDTTYFASPNHYLATKKSSLNSKNQLQVSEITYPSDLLPSTCTSISNCTSSYNSALSTCLSQYQAAAAACGSSGTCRANAYQDYLACQYQARSNFIDCREDYNDPLIVGSFANCLTNAFNNAATNYKGVLGMVSKNMLEPVEIVSKLNNTLKSATYLDYVWSSTENIPKRSEYSSIPVLNNTTNFQKVSLSGNSLVKDSRYELDASVVMRGSSVLDQVTKRGNQPVSYLYDSTNTEVVAEVSGASLADVAFT
ncbi:hypothetical protein, partial [Flavihumibacter cheonanensis]|uniref:hypothetical protein n=1 Tax=Flavihumibacter cheonanensis TaxID=1442385 RepID=UPI001EF8AC18